MSSKCDFAFFFGLFSLQVFWENSEPIQTAFRASHDKAHGLGSLNFIVLCEEIILLCSLILALASFIQCPLAQGSTEPFLIYPFHSSHYFINHSKSFFETEEHWSNCSSLTKLSSQKLLCQLRDTGMELLWTQTHGPGEKQNVSLPIFSPKEFSSSHIWSLLCGQKIEHCARNVNYPLTSNINLELTESNSKGWERNKQRSTRIINKKYTWTCSFQNHRIIFSCSLWLVFFWRLYYNF